MITSEIYNDVKALISTLSEYGIVKCGRHYSTLTEDEFKCISSFGDPYTFVLIHNDTPESFVEDFRALLNEITFKNNEHEKDIQKTLTGALEVMEELVKGESA